MQLKGLRAKFKDYDRDNLGHIKHSQVASLLEELYPDSRSSQTSRALVEELLKVGGVNDKGHLDFAGYIRIMRAFQDRKDYLQLEKETQAMKELNFSRHEVVELRQVFAMFDTD